MKRIPFTIGTAIDYLLLYIEKAKENDNIKKPISWALYQTWKWIDEREIEKPISDGIYPSIGVDVDGIWYVCGRCKKKLFRLVGNEPVEFDADSLPRYCPHCKWKVRWMNHE